MKREKCSNCGAEAAVVRGNYAFKESGLPVILQGIRIIRCKECGNEDPIIPRLARLMRVLAQAVIRKPYRLRGEEVRFLRKYLEMNGEEFSRLLHVDKTTLSKWENNDDRIGDQSDRLIRAIALALGEGLGEDIKDAVRHFSDIQPKSPKVTIRMDPDKLSYKYAAAAK